MEEKELQTFLALEHTHIRDDVRHDTNLLSDILSDDFVEIGKSGAIFNKADCLETGVSTIDVTITEFDARFLAQNLVQTFYHSADNVSQKNVRRTTIWRLEGETWRMLYHQGSIVL
ncbi:DUF4440 domain-containing protein [Paenalkalicoccus suaedae]|uniref:DUF4440 domain-containing protein n=1 Tax=Paenalkalicoccus suaedae TaxID=2592382 RepID=A0A859FB42_9BACI|nr:DUF4440 domain-containing protein [Paenalkalicoccus suaedae]QKS70018.1 DUF4440 domain-containing protein [Paenalkalicoccus suaedae]